MAQHYDVLYLMPEYIRRREEMIRSKPSLAKVLDQRIQAFLEDTSRLPRKKLAGARRSVWRTKVGDGERIIDEPLELPDSTASALLCVDQHDDALTYGKLYNADTLSVISRASVVSLAALARTGAAATTAVSSAVSSAGEPAGPGSQVKSDSTEPGADGQVMSRPRVPVPGYEEPAAIAITAADVPSLPRISLIRYLATLTDEQKQLARRPNRNLYVVRGAAGSGKTIIGVRRVEYILRNVGLFDSKPVLVTCYNRVLKNAIQTMLEDTLRQPLHEARVEVLTIYELLGRLEREFSLDTTLRKKKSLQQLVPLIAQTRSSFGELRPLQRMSDEELLAEIDDVIIGRGIATRSDYLEADRTGRGRLPPGAREEIWSIYRAFREACHNAGVESWSMLPARVEYHLQHHPLTEPRYAGVVIDEVQDLQPAAVRAVLALQAGSAENVLLLGDAAQSVYRSGFRWRHYGIAVHGGQVATINRCYRSTSPIVRAATSLISPQRDTFEDDLVLPEVHDTRGAPPVLVRTFRTADECLEQCVYAVGERIEAGYRRSSIALLLDDYTLRRQLCVRLRDLDISYEELYESGRRIELADESVKLLTTFAAKGLEFQTVVMPLVTERRYPTRNVPPLQAARSRRALYTAMLRAGWELIMFAPAEEAASCLDELDPGAVARQ